MARHSFLSISIVAKARILQDVAGVGNSIVVAYRSREVQLARPSSRLHFPGKWIAVVSEVPVPRDGEAKSAETSYPIATNFVAPIGISSYRSLAQQRDGVDGL